MDIEAFLDRTNRSKADLLRELGLDPKSSLISAYQSGRSNPSYDVCVKLLKIGMTPKELFGEEIDAKIRECYSSDGGAQIPSAFDSEEFREGVAKALADMRARGLIK